MTDFAPLISNPTSCCWRCRSVRHLRHLQGALCCATGLVDFTQKQSAAISIIGGADGPTAIYVTSRLAPELLGSIAVAAYSYMLWCPSSSPPS